MGYDRNRGRRRQDWFGGDARSGNFSGPHGRDEGGDRRDGQDRRDRGGRRDGGRDRGGRRDDRRERDRGGYPGESHREIVMPGDLLAQGLGMAGPGTYVEGGKVFAAQLGVRTFMGGKVGVLPLAGKYFPIPGDEVVGRILDVNPNFWLVDINAPYPAPLHIDESPWQVQSGESGKYLAQGDVALVKVQSVDIIRRARLTMRDSRGLRKLAGGMVMEISPSKVPRVIGKGGSMISMIKEGTGCSILVGQNGRIWLEGRPEMMMMAMDAIEMIERDAQQSGLTAKVEEYLRERLDKER